MREKQCTIVQFTERNHEGSIFVLYFNVIVERENVFSHEKENYINDSFFSKASRRMQCDRHKCV